MRAVFDNRNGTKQPSASAPPNVPQPSVPQPGGAPNDEQPAAPGRKFGWFWTAMVILGVVAFVIAIATTPTSTEDDNAISYSGFVQKVADDQVKAITISGTNGAVSGTYVNGTTFTTQGPSTGPADADLELLQAHGVALTYTAPSSGPSWWTSLLSLLLPVALIAGVWIWMGRRMRGQLTGAASFGKSPGHVYTTERPKTTFADVAGYDAVKADINEVVAFLKDPAKFRAVGARIPKGVLLVGPPGTGKTLIAKAVAGEAGVAFISVTGSHFMEMFVGVGAARVRGLFEEARKNAPSIVFVDEIDSIGRKRGAGVGGGHDEREQTLNQLLAEMDGFDTTEGIVVMAATNRPDVLDPALLRAGRFDRQVMIPLPSLDERVAILKVHCRDKQIAPDVDLGLIARGTPGMSGADLANLVNEAALTAVRRDAAVIGASDFDEARDRVLMGLKATSLVLDSEERQVIAHHEAGHAVMACLVDHADPVHKVTIIPTGMALGVTQQLPIKETHIVARAQLLDRLAVMLGGRAAEELAFGDVSTGAANDLSEATQLARKMVREWGMSDRFGPMAWGSSGPVFLGEDLVHTREYSDETAHLIDTEVEHILLEQQERTRLALTARRDALEAVAAALIDHETLSGTEVLALVAESGRAEHNGEHHG
ncbi:MAG: ATP-dependent zinc metalloprotease FtsH [Acidimicrobiia bacterium]